MNAKYQQVEFGASDFGYGGIKTARVVNDGDGLKMLTYTLPSVVGVGSTDTGALGLAGIMRQRPQARPMKISFDGLEYLVGEGLGQYAAPSERMDLFRFTDSPELRALLYASLAKLFKGRDIALVIGMPVEILKDEELAKNTEREMKKWLLGYHHFELEYLQGRQTIKQTKYFNIVNIRLKEQPLGTWLNWGFDNAGQWTNRKPLKAPALIIDCGFNTLDVYAFVNGHIDRRTDGDMLGVRRIAEMVIEQLDNQYSDLGLSLHEADELAQCVVAGKKAFVHIYGELTDVTNAVRQSIYKWLSDAETYLDRRLGKGVGQFRIFSTGGGSYALASRLNKRFPKMIVPANPVTSNAEGLAKLANRPGYLD